MKFEVIVGDMLAVLADREPDSIDSIVCDPPYHLTANKKGGIGPASVDLESPYGRARIGAGFMGKAWDGGDIAFRPETWAAVLRVAKPGAHLVAFGGTRTYHRMTVAIEDAGWEIRDSLCWLYGSGFPKSLDVAKAIDKRKDWRALRELQASVRQARERLGITQSEAARRMGLIGPDDTLGGGGYMWFETGMRIPTRDEYPRLKAAMGLDDSADLAFEAAEREVIGQHEGETPGFTGKRFTHTNRDITANASELAQRWAGWGTALKPAWEPIILARKPLGSTVAACVAEHGTGALNIDGCRIGFANDADKDETTSKNRHADFDSGRRTNAVLGQDKRPREQYDAPGRWPSNVLLDESAAALLDEQSPGASRFFYTAKAGRAERNAGLDGHAERPINWSSGTESPGTSQSEGTNRQAKNHHPTVKPLDLMQWLCRLVTPPGGLILDPFCGSGSTGRAAVAEGFAFVGVELDEDYAAIARARIRDYAPLFAAQDDDVPL